MCVQVALESCRAELEEQTSLVLEVKLQFLCRFIQNQLLLIFSSSSKPCVSVQASQALERLDDSKGEEKEEEVSRPTDQPSLTNQPTKFFR